MAMLAERKNALDSDVLLGLSPSTSLSDFESRHSNLGQALLALGRNSGPENLKTHLDRMLASFNQALRENSILTMLPNYSINPTGNESGHFLVIDLGGSTLRVAVISISEPGPGLSRADRVKIVASEKWSVENDFKTIDTAFFRWIASKIKQVVDSQDVVAAGSVFTTGITWSFALESTSYNRANICHVGKGYVVGKDVINQDLKMLLETNVLKYENIKIDVQAIINDSLAVYAAAAFTDSKTRLAMVLGTGFNVCCNLNASEDIHPLKQLGGPLVLFNTELSLFGHNFVELHTRYDTVIDSHFRHSLNFLPHMTLDPDTQEIFQPAELLTAGRYLPEIVRLIVVELIECKEIFTQQKNFGELYTPYDGFSGELLCFISENDDHAKISAALAKNYGWNVDLIPDTDITSLKLVVEAVIRRAAFVVAASMIAFMKLLQSHNGSINTNVVSVGYVGSVMEYFHRYRYMIAQLVNESSDMVDMGMRLEFHLVNESSLVGAAIGAAYHSYA